MSDFFSPTVFWLASALIIFGIEMTINTYFLLALSMGALAGGVTSFISPHINTQFVVAGIVTILAASAVFYFKKKQKNNNIQGLNDDNLDEGQEVFVEVIEKDGSSNVNYRGAKWKAKPYDEALEVGSYIIKEIKGSILFITKK